MLSSILAAASDKTDFVELDISIWWWVGLLAAIVVMLCIDLYRHRDDHVPSSKEALAESSVWVACGLAFSVIVAIAWGGKAFGEYISGYLIEKSLSVDNVFVWSMLFVTLAIPIKYQHRVLFWGIFGALVMRAAFIFAGSSLIGRFWWLLLVFGVFLIFTGIKVLRHRADEGTKESTRGIGLLRRFMPVSDEFDGHKFITRINGRKFATPLFAALVVVEVTDLIFAVDSVPAILAVSREPFLVFASNAFAILGLRAMYFLLANAREKFHYLSHGLGGILIFVGIKMSLSHWHHMNTYLSLAIILLMLTGAIVFSIQRNKKMGTSGPAPAHHH